MPDPDTQHASRPAQTQDFGGDLATRTHHALHHAAALFGLNAHGVRLLRLHSSAVYHLPSNRAVARVTPAGIGNGERVDIAVKITRWLSDRGFPTVEPLDGDQPITVEDETGGMTVSFWHYLPQPEPYQRPPAAALGTLIRTLHSLVDPPVALPSVRPMDRLKNSIELDLERPTPALDASSRAFLLSRIDELLHAYDHLGTPLGRGLIHFDAHTGNVLHSKDGYVLSDWDGAGIGPREWDLVVTASYARFGLPAVDRAAFADAYGYDITTWPEWVILRDMRELHSLGSYIRVAPAKPVAAAELQHRIQTLRSGDRTRRWNAAR